MDSLLSTGIRLLRTSKKELEARLLLAITSGGSGSGGSSVTANLTATAVVGVMVDARSCCQGADISDDIVGKSVTGCWPDLVQRPETSFFLFSPIFGGFRVQTKSRN